MPRKLVQSIKIGKRPTMTVVPEPDRDGATHTQMKLSDTVQGNSPFALRREVWDKRGASDYCKLLVVLSFGSQVPIILLFFSTYIWLEKNIIVNRYE